ncbi:hypothetical protein FQN50_002632 [Emmonsiellopsis sp. PD_5]|nr:hypothetical protein FQN50_002632 [Emmonsiellopsis sp. PD_5]
MPLHALLRRLLRILLPISITLTTYLYLYPLFTTCAFPPPDSSSTSSAFLTTLRQHVSPLDAALPPTRLAPFRLLVLADPQLEGDSSLPDPDDALLHRLTAHWALLSSSQSWQDAVSAARACLAHLVRADIPVSFRAARKRLDLFGNDFYLAHIYRSLQWWTRPSHVTVLGDLIGSQWVTDAEFEWRAWRYWNRVFRGGKRVEDDIAVTGTEGYDRDVEVELDGMGMGEEDSSAAWSRRIINIAGNHDVGYAGDISEGRMARFEREFGRANWDIRFQYPNLGGGKSTNATTSTTTTDGRSIPSIHLVVFNSLAMDSPALSPAIQSRTYTFLNDVIHRSHPVEDRSTFTLFLTHLPLHKRQGVCVDAPYFAFHDEDDKDMPEGEQPRFKAGGLREQNHLSDHVSHLGILQGVFGMSGNEDAVAKGRGRNGLVLTGHDHVGCDVLHFVNRTTDDADPEAPPPPPSWSWDAKRYPRHHVRRPDVDMEEAQTPHVREVTLRSMMGEFGGNAGFLSLWFDDGDDAGVGEWRYAISTCRLGVQHFWWAVHVVDLVTVLVGGLVGLGWVFGAGGEGVGKGVGKGVVKGEKRGGKVDGEKKGKK